jgi:chromosomal replication initiation ATPase DnaA
VSAQIPLPLLRPRTPQGRADFLVSPANAQAVTLIDRWPAWPGHALLVTGPAASGKSHLGDIWRGVSKAELVLPEALTTERVPSLIGAGALVLDRADAIRDDAALFHLLNFANAGEISLLLLARSAPEAWPPSRPDLLARLKGLARAALASPDEKLLEDLLIKLLAEREIGPLAPEALAQITARVERRYEAIARVVAALDHESLARKRPVTAAIVREVLANPEISGRTEG